METTDVYVSLEFTPNPNTLKYAVNRQLLERGASNFIKLEDAKDRSPLAYDILSIDGVAGVMIGKDFVTITKSEEGDWDNVHQKASDIIEKYLVEGKSVLTEAELNKASNKDYTEIEARIQAVLDEYVRPAVAKDGGDVMLDHFENGIVYISMKGACSGCPSSTMTLKMGIETKLKEYIPEVVEVTSV